MVEDRFVDRTFLGSGGMAVVYRAHDSDLKREVAIKELAEQFRNDEAMRALFYADAQKMAAAKGDQVVGVFDIVKGETPTIVLELMSNGSLANLIGNTAVEEHRTIEILRQIATGLVSVHEANMVHRDIKPENILVSQNDYKITDFGVAMIGDEDTLPFVTGKYAAPESFHNPDQINASSDIYSLGVMAAEMLLGAGRYDAAVREVMELAGGNPPDKTDLTFWQAWSSMDAQLPPLAELGVNPALAEIVDQMLAKSQSRRIASSADLVSRITALKDSLGSREEEETEEFEVKQNDKKKPLWFRLTLWIGGLLLASIAALLVASRFIGDDGFWVHVHSDPAGATITVDDELVADTLTPVELWLDWGQDVRIELEGEEPISFFLEEGMEALEPYQDGLRLNAVWAPQEVVIVDRDSAIRHIENAAGEIPLVEMALSGQAHNVVVVGDQIKLDLTPPSSGWLTLLLMAEDGRMLRISPAPGGTALRVDANEKLSLEEHIYIAAAAPAGVDTYVAIVTEQALMPPRFEGQEILEGAATLYRIEGDESSGVQYAKWLSEQLSQISSALGVYPVNVVEE